MTTIVGVGPITREHTKRVADKLVQRGIVKKSDSFEIKMQITTKSLVKSWAQKHLKMNDKDWDEIKIQQIVAAENSDIVFIYCELQDDAAKITINAKKLPQESNSEAPRITMYIDSRARKRHKAILNIAKTVREHSKFTVQTTVRIGKSDFLLRKREKGDTTPWGEIAPIIITQELPEFEIGEYKDIINPENVIQRDHEIEADEEDIEAEKVSQEIEDQLKKQNKRSHDISESNENSNGMPRKASRKDKDSIKDKDETGSDGDIESDGESKSNNILNSTPIPIQRNETLQKPTQKLMSIQEIPNKMIMKEHYFSLPETPARMNIHSRGSNMINTVPETPDYFNWNEQTNKKRNQSWTSSEYNENNYENNYENPLTGQEYPEDPLDTAMMTSQNMSVYENKSNKSTDIHHE